MITISRGTVNVACNDNGDIVLPAIITTTRLGRQSSWQLIVRAYKNDKHIRAIDYIDDHNIYQSHVAHILTETGLIGGKIRDSEPVIIREGKNVGRANQTGIIEQACKEAASSYLTRVRKTTPATTDTMHLPMLACVYENQELNSTNVYVQRKYDGIRAIAKWDSGVVMYSRTRKVYSGHECLKKLLEPILRQNPDVQLDGELYIHGYKLQQLSSKASRGLDMDYYVYDCITNNLEDTFSRRQERLASMLTSANLCSDNCKIVIVPTYSATGVDEIKKYYTKFLEEGYEGAMIRLDTPYEFGINGYRSSGLLKYKPRYDHEYVVCGYERAARGKAAGALMVIAKTEDGKEFVVTPALPLDERIALATPDKSGQTPFERKYLGKKIIVYYANISNDGIPLQATTELIIRDWD